MAVIQYKWPCNYFLQKQFALNEKYFLNLFAKKKNGGDQLLMRWRLSAAQKSKRR